MRDFYNGCNQADVVTGTLAYSALPEAVVLHKMAEECLVDKGDFEINEYPWHSIFEWCQTPYYGLVYDMDDASDLIQEFSYQTSTTYNVTRTSKDFGSFNFAETG